ncbi:MAG: DUF2892 domain-containing protein [Planctomycetes bacterium]|nr:DUF2892 domain-containing protein [Planctomycetota bacterium]
MIARANAAAGTRADSTRAADVAALRSRASLAPDGQAQTRDVPWSVDRWGRLIAGASVLVCTALGLLHHQLWLVGSLMCAFNLVLTSITDRCAVRALLRRLGAREREDLFLPGGVPRKL